MKKTLVIMAAGLGSRYGGIKQLEPVGPSGEIIMDYSIHDAMEAGFDKVAFIIRKDLEKDFKEVVGSRIEKKLETAYLYQELDRLPAGYRVPEGRIKPWGTGHAVLCCQGVVKEPFAVINADDYYGKEGFAAISRFLDAPQAADGRFHFCMTGFRLGNTLSEHGTVARGVCMVDQEGMLTKVAETMELHRIDEQQAEGRREGERIVLPLDCPVSMNMWGFTPDFLEELDLRFSGFLETIGENGQKAEYMLPAVVDALIREGRADVKVLSSQDRWFGVTYKEDREYVVSAFRSLVKKGVYPEELYRCNS